MKIKAILHNHTTYSKDGRLSLKELVGQLKDFQIICITEHAHDLDPKTFEKLVNDCKKYSNKKQLIIPGLEIGETKPHILGIGIRGFIRLDDMKKAIDAIHKNEGIAIFSHPFGYMCRKPSISEYSDLTGLDGIEIWNSSSHPKKHPSLRALQFFKKMARMNSRIVATGGVDIHNAIRKEPYLEFELKKLDKIEFLDKLKKGDYKMIYRNYIITSRGEFFLNGKRVENSLIHKGRFLLGDAKLIGLENINNTANFLLKKIGVKKEHRKKIGLLYRKLIKKIP